MKSPCIFVVVGGNSPSQNVVQSSWKIRDIFVQLQITINLEARPLGLILPSCLTRPSVADVADEANTADAEYNNLDNVDEANEVNWVDETSSVNEADVANMVDSFVEAKEDSIALLGSKFNSCFMMTSASVIAVAKISVVESVWNQIKICNNQPKRGCRCTVKGCFWFTAEG